MKFNLLRDFSTRSLLFLLLYITGTGNVWGDEYELVTSTNELVAGDRYIIASMKSGAGAVMAKYLSGNNCKQINATASNNRITYEDGMARLTLEDADGKWALHDGTYYMTTTDAEKNYLKGTQLVDKYAKFSISFNNNAAEIKSNGKGSYYYLRHNSYSEIFSCYESGNQSPVYLYKEVKNTNKEVTSIAITGKPVKTTYYIGETPSAEGLTVNATYENGNSGDITSLVSWTFEPAIIKSSTSYVTATASYGEKSAQHSYDIINKGEKEIHNYTLDLSSESYSSATTKTVKWDAVVADMTLSKGEGTTNANHHLGGNNTETNFYSYHVINITPKTTIHQIVFTTPTSENNTFASILCSSTYTNATASKDGNKVIITPKDGNNSISFTLNGMCGCTAMTVYYKPVVSTLTDAGYSTLCLPYNAIVPEGVVAYSASENNEYIRLTPIPDNTIAAIEGVVLKGAPGTYSFIATGDKVNAANGNLMIGVTKDTPLSADNNAYMLTRKKEDGSVAFRLLNTDYTLGANKAYLKLPGGTKARDIISVQWDENETGIMETMHRENDKDAAIYNLSGQRMKQTQKGINIINGKLVIR